MLIESGFYFYMMLVAIEARGEPTSCQKLIMDITHARVLDNAFPDNLVGVLSQRKQFPWWENRKEKLNKIPEQELDEILKLVVRHKFRDTELRYWSNPKTRRHDPYPKKQSFLSCANHEFK